MGGSPLEAKATQEYNGSGFTRLHPEGAERSAGPAELINMSGCPQTLRRNSAQAFTWLVRRRKAQVRLSKGEALANPRYSQQSRLGQN